MSKSVVLSWLSDLPLMQQSMILCAIRGFDGTVKQDASKPLVRFFRTCVLVPVDAEWPQNPDDTFFGEKPNLLQVKAFFHSIDQYFVHCFVHFLHGAEALAYKYPVPEIREFWMMVYKMGVKKLHMNPETEAEFDARLARGRNDEKPGDDESGE